MFRNIADTFANCFKVPELKSRILFTALVLVVVRLISFIPVPGLDHTKLAAFFNSNSQGGGAMGMANMFAGGALERCAVGAIGIMPYISATIIIQLLTAVWPRLSKLAREEGGRTKIVQYGRYLTVLLCFGWGFATAISWEKPEAAFGGGIGQLLTQFSADHLWWYRIQTTLLLTTGTMLLMWLGEQITERGIGNGVSLVITVGIVARLPMAAAGLMDMFGGSHPQHSFIGVGLVMLFLLAGVIAGVIAITQAQRKIPVQYAQRAVGRKMYQGGTSFMPLKVNYAGVMPIIFAQSILMFPPMIFKGAGIYFTNSPFWSDTFRSLASILDPQTASFWYLALYSMMILFFSYFWVATQFNEIQIADDLKKNGGYIPGVRPGPGTSDYLHKAMSRITLAGAIFLTVIAVIPIILSKPAYLNIPYSVASFFGGTSILITVGVLLDTMRQVESHLMMRHYDGFLKKGKLRGRF